MLERNQLEKKSFDEAVNLAIDLLPGLRHDMALIAERRKRQARDMEGTGRVGLNIPDPIDALLRIYHPDLYQKDAKLRGAAWLKFMKHPDSARFRINEKL